MDRSASFCTAVLLAVLLAPGCSTTQLPRSTIPGRSTALNFAALQGGGASITLRSQPSPIKSEYFTLTRDSLYWVESRTERAGAAPIDNLGSFTIQDRNAGWIYGFLGGGVLGYGVSALASRESNNRIIGVTGGMLVGGLIGAIIGVPRTYIIDLTR